MAAARNTTVRNTTPGRNPEAGFALWRSAMRWQRAVDAALRPASLTHTQFLVLSSASAAIAQERDAVKQRAIAERAGLDEATTSRVVRTLEKQGLLSRGPTFGDERAWRIVVSAKGRRLLRQARPLVEDVASRFFGLAVENSLARR